MLGDAASWTERAAQARSQSTSSLIVGSAQRWFAPESMARRPELSGRLLHALQDADDDSYARCCEALAAYDVRSTLGEIAVPVLAAVGSVRPGRPRIKGRRDRRGRAARERRAHRRRRPPSPAEQPEAVAALLRSFFALRLDDLVFPKGRLMPTDQERHDQGMTVRRAVLSDAHVDRSIAATTDLTADWQDFITHARRMGRRVVTARPRPPLALDRGAELAHRTRPP